MVGGILFFLFLVCLFSPSPFLYLPYSHAFLVLILILTYTPF